MAEYFLSGGPYSGKSYNIPSEPKAIEVPLYGENGAMSETARYERVKKTNQYKYVGRQKAGMAVTGAEYKAVGIMADLQKLKKKDKEK